MFDIRIVTIAAGIALVAITATAQEHGNRSPGERAGRGEQGRQEQGVPYPNVTGQNGPGVLSLLPANSVTEHADRYAVGQACLYGDGRHILRLFDQSGERSAAVFYTAFVAKSNDPAAPA